MHKKRIQKYLERLQKLSNGAKDLKGNPIPRPSGKLSGYSFDEEYTERLRELVGDLLNKESWSEKLSYEWLNRELSMCVQAGIGATSFRALNGRFKKLVRNTEAIIDPVSVFLPVAGLYLKTGPLKLGRAKLARISKSNLARLQRKTSRIIDESKHTKKQKVFLKEQLKKELQALDGKTCLLYTYVAEPSRAIELSEKDAESVLDAVMASISMAWPRNFKTGIGLQGDIHFDQRRVIVECKDSLHTASSVTGTRPVHLDKAWLKKLKQVGLNEFTRLLKPKRAPTGLESCILRSLHWYSTAQVESRREISLLNMIMSLESLLTPKDRGQPITTSVAEGCAFILGRKGASRKKIRTAVKALYDKRSAIAHGRASDISDGDLGILKELSFNVILWAARRADKFCSQDDLFSWIDTKRLA